MTAAHALDPPRHLRSRQGGEQSITFVELFFDLVYVFAVTQISHVLIEHLDLAGAGRAAFLLLVIWWAWIYTTWMVNWFDPDSPPVRIALLGVMGASLLLVRAHHGLERRVGRALVRRAARVGRPPSRLVAAGARGRAAGTRRRLRDTVARPLAHR